MDKDNDGFRKYFEAYESRNNIAEIVSNNLYEGDYENVGKKLKDDLATEFASVPEEFFIYGEMTGESFREGFMSEVQNLIDDIQVHLDVANTKTESSGETSQSIFSPTYYFTLPKYDFARDFFIYIDSRYIIWITFIHV